MALRIVATGGTFDKYYDELNGQLVFRESAIPSIVQRVRMTIAVEVELLPLIDSLDMTDEYRATIVETCRRSSERQIVIVHGTDTMKETALALAEANLQKTIVLTGAMIPYRVARSDALFNLGFACAAAQTLATGVHVAMNGQVFAGDQVRKNREAGVFESA